jgi:hypothetical protein
LPTSNEARTASGLMVCSADSGGDLVSGLSWQAAQAFS